MKAFFTERDLKKHVKTRTLLFKCSVTLDLSQIRKEYEGVDSTLLRWCTGFGVAGTQ